MFTLSLLDDMKQLSTPEDFGTFVETYRDRKIPGQPGEQFLSNLNLIKPFEETRDCGTTCLTGFVIKEKEKTIFTDRIPKGSCEDYLTMQLVKESFASSKRDFTEVSKEEET